jgi:hypothetical protein
MKWKKGGNRPESSTKMGGVPIPYSKKDQRTFTGRKCGVIVLHP